MEQPMEGVIKPEEKPKTEEEIDKMKRKGNRQKIKRTFGAKFIDPELQKKRLEKMEKKKSLKERVKYGASKTRSVFQFFSQLTFSRK